MRKITDFIVDKRNYILVIFIILSIFCLFLSNKVKINYDLTRYLPKDSSTKIGVDIMNKEFSGDETSTLEVMFTGLKEEEKADIKTYLQSIDDVKEVLYDNSSAYNKDDYTLYKVTVNAPADSKKASIVYDTIKDKYEDYEVDTSGDVATYNAPVLKLWVVALAIFSAMVILILMCESYVEPFLFLFVIGLAVFLNKGTNIFFPSVSNITNSICAILQMALSMDYSIMLMNRYRQEKEREKDNKKAMKEALYHSFISISSSSITTIVGLLALVFMSFTIGVDLGLVLAKGVIFSLLSIFFVLPSLILLFDKLIMKTSKKHFKINLNFLGKFSYLIRHFSLIIFILIFAGSFLIKSNLEYEFTAEENDRVKSVFKEDNTLALIYNNKEEDYFQNYCQSLGNDNRFKSVLCYGNTLSEDLKYNELNNKFASLNVSLNLDDNLIKTLYYNYFNKDNNIKLSYNAFINFILNDLVNNPEYSSFIDNDLKAGLSRLTYFTNNNQINLKRGYADIAGILGIDKSSIQNLFILYNSNYTQRTLSLPNAYNFIANNVLNNPSYASLIDSNSKELLKQIEPFLDKNFNNTKIKSSDMASIFNMDSALTENIYKYYNASGDLPESLTIKEFTDFVLNDVYPNPEYSSLFSEDVLLNLKLMNALTDENIINEKLDPNSLASLLQVDSDKVLMVLGLYNNINHTQENTISIKDFINFLLSYQDNDLIKTYLDENLLKKVNLASLVMTSSLEKTTYNYNEMNNILGIDTKNIYTLYHLKTSYISELSVREFISFILNTSDIYTSLDIDTQNKLNTLNMIIGYVEEDKAFNSKELSVLMGVSESNIKLMYSLYDMTYNGNNIKYSLYEVTNFILNNKSVSSTISSSNITKLKTINNVMKNSLNNTSFTKEELFKSLSSLEKNIEQNKIDLVYLLYGTQNNYDENYALSIEELITYLNEDILSDSKFAPFLTEDMVNTIKNSSQMASSSKDLLVGQNYSRIVLTTSLDNESKEMFDFIEKTNKDLAKHDAYLTGDSSMAYEMSKSFSKELNLITILTMVFIFVVVALSFKSVLIPLILVLLIECAVFITMDILTFEGDKVYFIAILIVQSILMGSTIDYAILYSSYYLEHRKTMDIKEALIESYNKSIHTIFSSASILIIVTLIVGNFASVIASKICITISKGALCSALLIILILPSMLAMFDKLIVKKDKKMD